MTYMDRCLQQVVLLDVGARQSRLEFLKLPHEGVNVLQQFAVLYEQVVRSCLTHTWTNMTVDIMPC